MGLRKQRRECSGIGGYGGRAYRAVIVTGQEMRQPRLVWLFSVDRVDFRKEAETPRSERLLPTSAIDRLAAIPI